MRTNFISSVIDCEQQSTNGAFSSQPYREQVWGAPDFIKARMLFANLNGYRTEQLPDGSTVIYETDHDFAMRQQKKLSDKPADTPPP